jgi:hypothetical protein
MEIEIHKYIYDTDGGTGCDLFLDRESAVAALYSKAVAEGYQGESDECSIGDWKDANYSGLDTFYVDSEKLELPEPLANALSNSAEFLKALLDATPDEATDLLTNSGEEVEGEIRKVLDS